MFSLLNKKENDHNEPIWTCCWPRHEAEQIDYIVTGSLDNFGKIWRWDDIDLKPLHNLEGHQLGVVSAVSSQDGLRVATSSIDCTIRVWDPMTGLPLFSTIDAGPVDSWTVTLTPDGVRLATGSQGGKVHLYNVETGTKESTFETGGKFILSLCYSPDGTHLAVGSQDGGIYVFDLETGSNIHAESHAMPIRSLKYARDGKLIFSASDDKYIKVHDAASAISVVSTLSGHTGWALSVDPTSDGRYLASGSADSTVRVWDLAQRQQLHKFVDHSDQVWSVAFNHNGSRLLSVSEDKSMIIYNVPV